MGRARHENPSKDALRKREARARERAAREAMEAARKSNGAAASAVADQCDARLAGARDAPELPIPPTDPAAAVVSWAETALIVPSGRLAGQPFRIPQWQREWLEAALRPGIGQSGLSVSRGKTASPASSPCSCWPTSADRFIGGDGGEP